MRVSSTRFEPLQATQFSAGSLPTSACNVAWVCPVAIVSWASIYGLAFRQARESLARTRWARWWEPSAN